MTTLYFTPDIVQHIAELSVLTSGDLLSLCLVNKDCFSVVYPILNRIQKEKGYDIEYALENRLSKMFTFLLEKENSFNKELYDWICYTMCERMPSTEFTLPFFEHYKQHFDNETLKRFAINHFEHVKYFLLNGFDLSIDENAILYYCICAENMECAKLLLTDRKVREGSMKKIFDSCSLSIRRNEVLEEIAMIQINKKAVISYVYLYLCSYISTPLMYIWPGMSVGEILSNELKLHVILLHIACVSIIYLILDSMAIVINAKIFYRKITHIGLMMKLLKRQKDIILGLSQFTFRIFKAWKRLNCFHKIKRTL